LPARRDVNRISFCGILIERKWPEIFPAIFLCAMRSVIAEPAKFAIGDSRRKCFSQ